MIENKLITGLKLYKFLKNNYSTHENKYQNAIVNNIIESLKDPEAKVANRLSLSRIPLGMIMPLTAKFAKKGRLTLTMTSFYALSDFLDGFYSKHIIHHPTKGGTYIDAICDKIGAIELILPAILQNPALLINGTLETIISIVNINSTNEGTKVQSTKLGKLKMWPLSAALICTYMSKSGFKIKNLEISKENFAAMANILIPITAVLETINIIEYHNLSKDNVEENEYIEIDNEKPKTITKQKRS